MTDEPTKPSPEESGAEEQQAFKLYYTLNQDASDKKRRGAGRQRRSKKVEVVGPESELTAATLKLRDREQTMKLRLRLAWFTMIAVAVQLAAANLLFWNYLARESWRDGTPPEVVVAWLSATVVEVIGIVLVIARNLFPSTDKNLSRRDLVRIVKKLEKDDAN